MELSTNSQGDITGSQGEITGSQGEMTSSQRELTSSQGVMTNSQGEGTSSQGERTGHEVDPDLQGPFHDATIVLFHLDMTDEPKAPNKEICQIAAICNGEKFNVFIMPDSKLITRKATLEHGIQIRRNGRIDYKLLKNGHEVPAVSPNEGLTEFLEFLREQTGQTRTVLLAAHNCSAFTRHILLRQIKQCDLLDSFQSIVLGTIDTYLILKKKLKSRDLEKKSFKLIILAKDYLPGNFEAPQDATDSVNILTLLIEAFGYTDAMMKQYTEDLDVWLRSIDLKEDFKDVLSKTMILKIAEAGISISELKDKYRANGSEGVSWYLEQKLNEKIQGAKKTTEIIVKINDKLSKLLDNNGNGN